ncbi:hypothetical protein K435DRAFT_862536 [Dendrothele bispora CBS 962.96]|uniref:Zn(2)-C6 fungal-type domain-containing protein n=1 Tax=Dendrothele bispora (strain CBS 962.96) TaxID=1314807 RepID=A0A4S8LTR6_DENBC|nr:hypothetical protein K435DRAFT_862536 [Dendrothele bispora CBS 962.96]
MSGNTLQRIPRGGACSNCRYRRIKCDGALPKCSNCERSSGRFSDCEYSVRDYSEIEYLERQIRELESRIQERETSLATEQTNGSVVLHDPYLQTPTATQMQYVWAPRMVPPALKFGEVPLQLRQNLLSAFIPYANELGFFLDLSEVCNTIMTTPNPSQGTSDAGAVPVTPALIHVIFLLGSHLSTSPQVTILEPGFLSIAQGSVSHILNSPISTMPGPSATSNYPHRKVLGAIQSHVLLAQYYFHTGRKLEGKYSVTIAIALVLGTKMHRIRSKEIVSGRSQMQMTLGRNNHATEVFLSGSEAPQPEFHEQKEETQSINAFWTPNLRIGCATVGNGWLCARSLLALNSRWAAVEGYGSSFPYWKPAMRIDTPWPWVNLTPATRNSSTIQRFLANHQDDAHSTLALYAKACILFEQVFELTNRYERNQSSPSPSPTLSAPDFLSVLNNLTRLVTQLMSQLPSISSIQDTPPSNSISAQASSSGSKKRELLVIHTVTRVAIIQLYTLFENTSRSSSDEQTRTHKLKLEAANESAKMIGLVDGRGVIFIDSIMAILWPKVVHVLVTELYRLRGRGLQDPRLVDYQKSFDLIVQAMSGLASSSPLMSEQLKKVQEIS